jgi:hypothetical protein
MTTDSAHAHVVASEQKLTRRQAAIIGAFTGITAGPFEDVQQLGDELMGHSTWTHEYANEKFVDELRERARPLFLAICAERASESAGEVQK